MIRTSLVHERALMLTFENLNYNHLFYFWAVAHDGSVTAACERLMVSQPTISYQLRKLEEALGEKLFQRQGRGLVLTDFGNQIYYYANEMFTLGREIVESAGGTMKAPGKLTVGVPDILPKLITFRLLEPAFHLENPVRVIVHEAKLDKLIAEMSIHRFDMVLSDAPLSTSLSIKAFSHHLGGCGTTFFGTTSLAKKHQADFPHSLNSAPMLLPTDSTLLRRSLDLWFRNHEISPKIVGESEDSALLKEFGQAGLGIFPAPTAIESEIHQQFKVKTIGHLPEVRSEFYAITINRRLRHPAVIAISEAAREGLFD